MATNNTHTEKGNEMNESINARGPRNTCPNSVGTIFVASWGSTMTLVDFYQVVGVTKSGKSVKVRQISSRRVTDEDRGGDFKVVPIPDDIRGETMTKRLQVSGYNGETFFNHPRSRFAAFVWDGTPQTVNTYD